jgi:hypothetical protein
MALKVMEENEKIITIATQDTKSSFWNKKIFEIELIKFCMFFFQQNFKYQTFRNFFLLIIINFFEGVKFNCTSKDSKICHFKLNTTNCGVRHHHCKESSSYQPICLWLVFKLSIFVTIVSNTHNIMIKTTCNNIFNYKMVLNYKYDYHL